MTWGLIHREKTLLIEYIECKISHFKLTQLNIVINTMKAYNYTCKKI